MHATVHCREHSFANQLTWRCCRYAGGKFVQSASTYPPLIVGTCTPISAHTLPNKQECSILGLGGTVFASSTLPELLCWRDAPINQTRTHLSNSCSSNREHTQLHTRSQSAEVRNGNIYFLKCTFLLHFLYF